MATITASQVKELREKTGVGMMDCKKALSQTDGNFDSAVQWLREKGLSAAAKKADRSTNEGRVFTATNSDNTESVIVEINCETDFVASNDEFISFGNQLAQSIVDNNIAAGADITALTVNGQKLDTLLPDLILKLGENLTVKQFQKITGASVGSYVHMNGKIGVLAAFDSKVDEDLQKDVAMHIAAANPTYLSNTQIPDEVKVKETEILRIQVLAEGKPENIVDKIVEGKLNKQFKEECLLDQDFVKDPEKTIKQILPAGSTVTNFIRFSLI